jgi:hypothetical protein
VLCALHEFPICYRLSYSSPIWALHKQAVLPPLLALVAAAAEVHEARERDVAAARRRGGVPDIDRHAGMATDQDEPPAAELLLWATGAPC